MLVLTRKINESILINSTIEVRVLRTHKNKVTIGLSAPHDVPICRGELQPEYTLDIKELEHVTSN
jgi:carbon storage regulator